MTRALDDLFVVDCLKELPWPYGHHGQDERLIQDSAGRLHRVLADSPESPFACAAEALAGILGRYFGLRVPDSAPVRFNHKTMLAIAWDPSWEPYYPSALEEAGLGPKDAAAIIALDLWLGNIGRAQGGLVLRRDWEKNGAESLTLHLVRHRFMFLGLYGEDDEGGLLEAIPPSVEEIVGHHPLAMSVSNQHDFDPILTRFERYPGDDLRDAIRQVPAEWLTPGQKAQVFRYLDSRRSSLRRLLPQLRDVCPTWE